MIAWFRNRIATELGATDVPVYDHKPDELIDAPCIVVDRPTIEMDVQHYTFTTSVIVVGRRDGSHDSQLELDALTSWAMHQLAGPEIAVQRVDPSTATVAEHTYPSYTITVSCGATVSMTQGQPI